MNFPSYYPAWMWAYFAVMGSLAILFLALLFWTWMKATRVAAAGLKRALRWNVSGYVALFTAVWFACGIGAGPGFLLSTDPNMRNPTLASGAAMGGMFFSVLGWALLWVGMRKMLEHAQEAGPAKDR